MPCQFRSLVWPTDTLSSQNDIRAWLCRHRLVKNLEKIKIYIELDCFYPPDEGFSGFLEDWRDDVYSGAANYYTLACVLQNSLIPRKAVLKKAISSYTVIGSLKMVDFQIRLNPSSPQTLVQNLPFVRFSAVFEGEERKARFVYQVFTDEWIDQCMDWLPDICDTGTDSD